jgi:multiple sugar transport system ATP-binding protein
MRAELSRLHDRLGVTTVYVTHDQIEAMTLGQRVAVMRDGLLQQVDEPQTLYKEPANLFVAAFIGSPSMNLVDATVDDGAVSFAGTRIPLAGDRRPREGGRVILGVRPEAFEDVEFAPPGQPMLDVEVAVVEELGAETHLIFPVEAERVDAEDVAAAVDDEEGEAKLLADDQRALFTARVDPRSKARQGGRLRVAVDPTQLYFFDPESKESLMKAPAEPARA